MKAKDIILIVATLGIGYLIYKAYAKPSKPSKPSTHEGYEHCGSTQYKFYCGGETYCCNTPATIISEIYDTEEPVRIVYNICENGVLKSYHKDFNTREEAIQWVRSLQGDVSDICLVTAYHISKPSGGGGGGKPGRPTPLPT